MATYKGRRYDDYKVAVTVDGEDLERRRDLLTGAFEFDIGPASWTGTAQLAVALLADQFRRSGLRKAAADKRAMALFSQFRKEVIEPIDGDEFTLTSAQIAATVAAL